VGQGRTPQEASRNAQLQTCTQYVGGQPQFFRGCREIPENNGPGFGHRPNRPGPGWGHGREEWTCTYTCGSKEFQEPKVGHGRNQYEAMRDAQAQQCTQYEGGFPKYFRGCQQTR
jgi:hypothetical protein